MPRVEVTLSLTERQAEALRTLSRLADLSPEIYASEVLLKHLCHAFPASVQRRTHGNQPTDG